MEDRYIIIEDAGEWILDTKTDELLYIEEACDKLNAYQHDLNVVGAFFRDVIKGIQEEG